MKCFRCGTLNHVKAVEPRVNASERTVCGINPARLTQ
ncbi:Com family DNA-binding transcriptional regulator [Pseudomonas sp. SWRI102]|uniref:Com family DNA-binding transcriptional regulator n=1 Tax=Pseudomonas marvdashtae TaxID=2745500 RepID=A0A923JST6_9PSED|nr:Com family DNA-binding transcriptional regulator [Pseudomonas marvdashtae]